MTPEEKKARVFGAGYDVGISSDPHLPHYVRAHLEEFGGAYIIWDPLDDEDGFKLAGDDLEAMISEAFDHLELDRAEPVT